MPLHFAARLGCVPLVQLLLDSKADPLAETNNGETAASLAMERVRAMDDRAPAFAAIVRMLPQ